jgi:hypothetical protein
MSRRAKITYPHSTVGNSTPTEKYHVGSVVFLPFRITSDEGEEGFLLEALHEEVSEQFDPPGAQIIISKEILP